MDDIERIWQRIEARLARPDDPATPQLAPGASAAAISELEGILGISLPTDFQASYRLHDGGYTVELVTEMEIQPLSEIVTLWRSLQELLEDESWAQQPPYYFTDPVVLREGYQPGPVQPVWWHARWIPFGMDFAGNLTCLDLAPAPGGHVGQIIDWDHECGPSQVLYSGFRQLLEAFADQLLGDSGEQAT